MVSRRRAPLTDQPNEVLSLGNIEAFRKECRKAVSAALENAEIGFTEPRRIRDNRHLCSLSGPGATQANAGKFTYQVIPFLRIGTTIYWLAVTFEFKYIEGEPFLMTTSIVVFKGEPTDPDKTALLRAEWDTNDQEVRGKHAQPHWHVYAGRINSMLVTEDPEFLDELIREFGEDEVSTLHDSQNTTSVLGWDTAEWFHFAMASGWHERDREPIFVQLNGQRLVNWLNGCISYTRGQLAYLHSEK